jgi:alcohol dehydrogenase (NADP+)
MSTARGYAVQNKTAPFAPFTFERREVGPRDVAIDILFCGICHSDLHTAREEWSGTVYPCCPGHEIVGRVSKVGNDVKGFAVGALAGVGCMVGSCGTCASCRDGLQQYCGNNQGVWTYNSTDPHKTMPATYGGYSNHIVVDEKFCLRIADGQNLAAVAPLLCAGITTYSPLKHWGAGKGKRVGVVGLGGLGHMAVKLSHAFGAETVLFTTSESKVADGKRLGADEVVISKNADAMAKQKDRFDLIIDTVAVSHALADFTGLLARDGALVLVGVPEKNHTWPGVGNLLGRRRQIAASLIGGLPETQEMLDFCAAKKITADIEMTKAQDIDAAHQRMLKSDVKYRFVIDMSTL